MVRCRVLSLADAGVRRSRGQGRSCGDGCTVAEGGVQRASRESGWYHSRGQHVSRTYKERTRLAYHQAQGAHLRGREPGGGWASNVEDDFSKSKYRFASVKLTRTDHSLPKSSSPPSPRPQATYILYKYNVPCSTVPSLL